VSKLYLVETYNSSSSVEKIVGIFKSESNAESFREDYMMRHNTRCVVRTITTDIEYDSIIKVAGNDKL